MGKIINPIEVYKSSYFRARHKLSYEGAISHITQHATGAEPLFIEEQDYLCMLYLVKKICKKFRLDILSFVLMINHLHLLIKMNASNLSQAMKELFQTYARYFNKKYDRKGHVFSGAYRATLCLEEAHLISSSLYIHRNPVEAGLVKKGEDYRWSSCALFVKNIYRETFVDFKYILNILDSDIVKAHDEYNRLLKKANVGKTTSFLEQTKALNKIVDILKNDSIKWNQSQNLLIDKNLERVIEELKNKGRLTKPRDIEARKFLIEQLKARGFNMVEIARKLDLSRRGIYGALK